MTAPLAQIVAELRELMGKATPGPWNYLQSKTLIHLEKDGDGQSIASFSKKNLADVELIHAMRNALPALPALLDAAERVHKMDADPTSIDAVAEELAKVTKQRDDAISLHGAAVRLFEGMEKPNKTISKLEKEIASKLEIINELGENCNAFKAQLQAASAGCEAREETCSRLSDELKAMTAERDNLSIENTNYVNGDLASETRRRAERAEAQLAVIKDQQIQDREARENWMLHAIKLEKERDELAARITAVEQRCDEYKYEWEMACERDRSACMRTREAEVKLPDDKIRITTYRLDGTIKSEGKYYD